MFISIDKRKCRSYTNQIYDTLRNKILSGELEGGAALPSTRELSGELSVSRNTILAAYDMLSADGFVQSVPGSGIYVCHGAKAVRQPIQVLDYQTASLSDNLVLQNIINFDSGIPALDLFPGNKWITTFSQTFRDAPVSALGYDDPQGRSELRCTLASYLKKSRGITCSADQILITSGAKQGLTLVAKCLLNSDSEVWLEDPSNRNVKEIFSYHTSHITPIPVDQEGIMINQFPKDKNPSLIFVTPSHQFPMGGILSIQRRLELIQYAQKSNCFIIEDDYDSEFRYDRSPIKSLYELDPDHIIYIGTFSKVLFPSLRLGYIVLPPVLVPKFRHWKRLSDHHSDSISQLTMMRFIESGTL
ncbi:MAG: PLP-dependent aminotransferase family protein, partial [Bacillota bacterium]